MSDAKSTLEPGRKGVRVQAGRKRRSAARLAAVQALYQINLTGADPASVVVEFREHRLGQDPAGGGGPATIEPDAGYFEALVRGVIGRREEIDAMLIPALAEGWTLARLEVVLRAALRLGTFELLAITDVPARVVINEYVNIAHMFFAGKEPGFINGVLDRLARRLRPSELTGADAGSRIGGHQGA